jgi:hypothetical protein
MTRLNKRPMRKTDPIEEESWTCPICEWHGWSRGAALRMRERTENAFRGRQPY